MTKVNDPIAETTIVVKKKNDSPINVQVKIGRPVLDKDGNGEPVWLCHVQIDGMQDFNKPVQGVTSFHALSEAFSNLYSMFHIEGFGKAKFGDTGGVLGEAVWPDPGVSIDQYFGFDVALD